VVLWTRLAPEPLHGGGMPMARVELGWEIARDARMREVIQRGTAVARPELGYSVHVEVGGLEPAREYWYRFRVGTEGSPIGRTVTAPAAGTLQQRLRFALVRCNHYETGYFTAYRHMAAERPDFVFHSGDYIYEGREIADRPRRHNGDEIHTLVDYRNRYALYKSDPDFKAAHAATPFVISFDDHEVENNWASAQSEDTDMPRATVLGDQQERWLDDGLSASRARWNVLAQQVMVARRRLGAAGDLISMDKWDAYPAVQKRLHDFLAERRPANPIVLTGDVHNACVGELKADYERPSTGPRITASSSVSRCRGIRSPIARASSSRPADRWRWRCDRASLLSNSPPRQHLLVAPPRLELGDAHKIAQHVAVGAKGPASRRSRLKTRSATRTSSPPFAARDRGGAREARDGEVP